MKVRKITAMRFRPQQSDKLLVANKSGFVYEIEISEYTLLIKPVLKWIERAGGQPVIHHITLIDIYFNIHGLRLSILRQFHGILFTAFLLILRASRANGFRSDRKHTIAALMPNKSFCEGMVLSKIEYLRKYLVGTLVGGWGGEGGGKGRGEGSKGSEVSEGE